MDGSPYIGNFFPEGNFFGADRPLEDQFADLGPGELLLEQRHVALGGGQGLDAAVVPGPGEIGRQQLLFPGVGFQLGAGIDVQDGNGDVDLVLDLVDDLQAFLGFGPGLGGVREI